MCMAVIGVVCTLQAVPCMRHITSLPNLTVVLFLLPACAGMYLKQGCKTELKLGHATRILGIHTYPTH